MFALSMFQLAAVFLALLSSAAASTITGRVINRTTNKPSAGDRVILYRVGRSMHEEQHGISDSRGMFRFEGLARAQYLVAAFHHGVAYHTGLTNGIAPLDISVFDAAARLRDIHEDSDTLFFESDGATLAVTEFFVVANHSNPPRTLTGTSTFDFAIPNHALLDSVAVQPPSTLPHSTSVFPQRAAGRYGIAYPIRPGITKIRVLYRVPYSGSTSIAPVLLRPVGTMAVKVPATMRVNTGQPNFFEYRGEENGLSVYTAKDLRPGRIPAFSLSGIGHLREVNNAKPPVLEAPSPTELEHAQEFMPQSNSKRAFLRITKRTLALYYEVPVLFTALLIGVGALINRRRCSIRPRESISAVSKEIS